ncbi:MAG: hypothetical protein C4542_07160 [Dehalococcoidia bacterium]|nr:MAG: hypothetical protein C4542_07160 [Dehalococcoidia bacterium]
MLKKETVMEIFLIFVGIALLLGFISATVEAYSKANAYNNIISEFGVKTCSQLKEKIKRETSDLTQKLESFKQEEEKQRILLGSRLMEQKARLDTLYQEQGTRLEKLRETHSTRLEKIKENHITSLEKLDEEQRLNLEKIAKEKSQGFPWLASAYADYFNLLDKQAANRLVNKAFPAPKAAETVRELAAQRRQSEKISRILKYKLEYYESLFPWLIDFSAEGIDELIEQTMVPKDTLGVLEENDDAAKIWLTQAEYSNLSNPEKYQIALDRYWKRKKTNWEIGRDYERYVGYIYEQKGYTVTYKGIVAGFEDLGRDLICERGKDVAIIQCKYWAKTKQIHEKHVFQLYGTVISYKIDHPEAKVEPVFVTHTVLSDMAKKFAKMLDISITENYDLLPYPCIKCNVSHRDGTKIYHLPFDQQYDRTTIEEERNETYVDTVKEAEEIGFRRAYRWRGQSNQ